MVAAAVQGQTHADSANKMIIVKVSVLFPIAWEAGQANNNVILGVALERGIKKRHSFQFTGLFDNAKSGDQEHYRNTFFIEDYKFFLKKENHFGGFYSGINGEEIIEYTSYVSYGNMYSALEYRDFRIGGGLLIGYRNCFDHHFTIDLLCGYMWGYLIDRKITKQINSYIHGDKVETYPRFAINFGYKF